MFPVTSLRYDPHLNPMKRRDFLNMSAGAAVVAVAPMPSLAATAQATFRKPLYVWAVAMARAGNPISAATLSKALNVPASEATVIMNRLLARGVIGVPNAAGVARAVVKPMPVAANTPSGLEARLKRMAKAVQRGPGSSPGRVEPEAPTLSADDCAPPEASDAARSTE